MPPAVAALDSQGRKESAVDDEVGAGDVDCSVAGQQYDEVGHLFGAVHPPRHRISGGLFGDILGVAAAGAATVAATPSSPSHSRVATGPGLNVLTGGSSYDKKNPSC